jgi:molybdopterin biosynthesis enzyme MoaB
MDPHKPAILLVGGGEGMGPVEKTVDGVAEVSEAAVPGCAVEGT